MREMVGGCCVCSDERGWAENPLVYCDGHGCSVAVHQACYGIVQVPTGPWFCRKCESQERAARRCELCPHKDGALKRTDSGGKYHLVPVQFANVLTMEPIILQYVPHERYNKVGICIRVYIYETLLNRLRNMYHTVAQMAGLLCEEEGPEADNVKYCGYCKHHYNKMVKNTMTSYPRKAFLTALHKTPRCLSQCFNGFPSVLGQISSSHHSSKDGEGKSKKLSSHGHSHRSKKTGSTGKSCSSSSCSSSPFNTDEEEEEEEEDCKYHKPPALTPAEGPLAGSQGHDRPEGNSSPFENKVTISTFGSIMRITSSSGTPPILEEADPEDKATLPPPLPRERRHRGNKKSRHGPGRPRGSKNRERRGEEEHHHHHHHTAPPPLALTSSLYPSPSSIPHPTFSSTLPPTATSSTSSSFSSSSSSTGSFSTGRGNSLLGSGESERVGVCGSPLASCVW
uniref:MLLT6, PHD finger containing n=1 Tax=Neolamprologus brichardi TaxID=32507 RepID=A0A3Q4HJK4_NEOBR